MTHSESSSTVVSRLKASLATIVPVYNEGANARPLVERLKGIARNCEVLLVDASDDLQSMRILDQLMHEQYEKMPAEQRLRMIRTTHAGRAMQMNLGVRKTDSPRLLFLHADTQLPIDALELIERQFEAGHHWGRFNVRLHARGWPYRVIEFMMNLRSALTGIATGDQAIFVSREIFSKVGGYPSIALMEDIALSKALKQHARPALICKSVTTSARRWQKGGVVHTVLLMWRLRFLYWIGVSPDRLAMMYRNVR